MHVCLENSRFQKVLSYFYDIFGAAIGRHQVKNITYVRVYTHCSVTGCSALIVGSMAEILLRAACISDIIIRNCNEFYFTNLRIVALCK